MVEGAHNLRSAPIPLFYISYLLGIKVIKSYGETDNLITFYNLHNLVTSDKMKYFTKEISKIITFLYIVSRETWLYPNSTLGELYKKELSDRSAIDIRAIRGLAAFTPHSSFLTPHCLYRFP